MEQRLQESDRHMAQQQSEPEGPQQRGRFGPPPAGVFNSLEGLSPLSQGLVRMDRVVSKKLLLDNTDANDHIAHPPPSLPSGRHLSAPPDLSPATVIATGGSPGMFPAGTAWSPDGRPLTSCSLSPVFSPSPAPHGSEDCELACTSEQVAIGPDYPTPLPTSLLPGPSTSPPTGRRGPPVPPIALASMLPSPSTQGGIGRAMSPRTSETSHAGLLPQPLQHSPLPTPVPRPTSTACDETLGSSASGGATPLVYSMSSVGGGQEGASMCPWTPLSVTQPNTSRSNPGGSSMPNSARGEWSALPGPFPTLALVSDGSAAVVAECVSRPSASPAGSPPDSARAPAETQRSGVSDAASPIGSGATTCRRQMVCSGSGTPNRPGTARSRGTPLSASRTARGSKDQQGKAAPPSRIPGPHAGHRGASSGPGGNRRVQAGASHVDSNDACAHTGGDGSDE